MNVVSLCQFVLQEVEKIYLDKQNDFFSNLEEQINAHDSPISTLSYYVHSLIYQ